MPVEVWLSCQNDDVLGRFARWRESHTLRTVPEVAGGGTGNTGSDEVRDI
jgi:hypothetical protein